MELVSLFLVCSQLSATFAFGATYDHRAHISDDFRKFTREKQVLKGLHKLSILSMCLIYSVRRLKGSLWADLQVITITE
jgi:hypothetical protein